MNALVYVDIDQGIHKVKLKNALNEKRKKLRGFSFSINMANFEAFRRTKKLISNLFFLKSGLVSDFCDWEKSILLQDLLSRNFLYRNVKHATPLNGGGTICEKKISLL